MNSRGLVVFFSFVNVKKNKKKENVYCIVYVLILFHFDYNKKNNNILFRFRE